ncbi:hypothetical protein [Variovorax sp. LT1R16]|uniref:hypothetical protein n=1 Tax=Variovorax sp. LT1R16 TaxID=3443728 RepID=UPI003F46801F
MKFMAFTAAFCCGFACAGEPLEDATRDAAVLCARLNAESLARCGTLSGKSTELSEARRAVARMFDARLRFMQKCERKAGLSACATEADWLMLAAMNDVPSKP